MFQKSALEDQVECLKTKPHLVVKIFDFCDAESFPNINYTAMKLFFKQ